MKRVEREYHVLGTGIGFGEGPVWRSGTQDLVFCSLSTARVLRWSAAEGITTLARLPAGGANGLAEGPDGRLYLAQTGGSHPHAPAPLDCRAAGGVQVIDHAGRVEWVTLAPFEPNDLCFGPDGWIYVTDPTRPVKRRDARLWHCNVETGEVRIVKMVSVNDCGIPINSMTTESQIIGSMIQGASWALFEDRTLDRSYGTMVNPNLEWYKILDTFFGHNCVHQNIPLAIEMASSCEHPDARWLTEACAGKDLTTKEDAKRVFSALGQKNETSSMVVTQSRTVIASANAPISRKHSALSIKVFSSRVNDYISTQLKRFL